MPGTFVTPQILPCNEADFTLVKKYIADFCLDNNDLKAGQFLVAKKGTQIVGFGRLRNYGECNELCSLGVLETHRKQGIGSKLSAFLIDKSPDPLYTVTVIPSFFKKLGFYETKAFPTAIGDKLSYCTRQLAVEDPYSVMKMAKI